MVSRQLRGSVLCRLFVLACAVAVASATPQGDAATRALTATDIPSLTPPMGFNTWNLFKGKISEDLMKETADVMVTSGLFAAGYNYVNLDDGWCIGRNASGHIIPDPVLFPSGMHALAKYVHSKGLKFGIYTDVGHKTCMGRPGSLNYETQDVESYAEWGVDYIKVDNCWAGKVHGGDDPTALPVQERYRRFGAALDAVDRDMVFSVCVWGVQDPYLWAPELGANSWRTTEDIEDNWDDILRILDNNIGLSKYAGPGHFNDLDMLEVGNGGMVFDAYQSHFALWSLLKSPLLIGCDLRNMTDETKSILLAKEVIAVNQDLLGEAGELVWAEGSKQIWAGDLNDASYAVVLFNRHALTSQYPTINITLDFASLGIRKGTNCSLRDLYLEEELGVFEGSFTTAVRKNGCIMLKVSPQY